jgi:hypothetical protein
MYSAFPRTCAAFVFLFFAAIFLSAQNLAEKPLQYGKANEDRVWLAVEEQARGQLRVEPIATVDDNELKPIQTSCITYEETPEDFSAKYLQSSTKYSLLFGGASIGEGQIGEQNRAAGTANLIYKEPQKIRSQVRALATNAPPGDFRVASREPATVEQRASALALARDVFSQHGVAEVLLPKVRAEYVTRTYLAPSPQPSLIGSFSLDTGDKDELIHHLFFIASQPGEMLQPEFLWIHLSESATDEEVLRLVDHADLFRNGQDEVVAKLVSVATQSHRYLIFRRTKDGAHWEQIFKTEPLGCSS